MKRFNHELLLKMRLDENLTQEDFAERIEIDVSTYKKYESGRVNKPDFKIRHPRRHNILYLMAQHLGLESPEALLLEVAPVPAPARTPPGSVAIAASRALSPPPGALASHAGAAARPVPTSGSNVLSIDGQKIVLLHRYALEPDTALVEFLERRLCDAGYDVFVDRHASEGMGWVRDLEHQLVSADVVVPILSAGSASSEMLAYEIRTARDAAARQGKPRLLPVCFEYDGPFSDEITIALGAVTPLLWPGNRDREDLFKSVLETIKSGDADPPASVRPWQLEPIRGAIPLDCSFYVVRPVDLQLNAAIEAHTSIVLIKGARQMGKTSLLARGLQTARESGKQVVLTDLQSLNDVHFQSADVFLRALAELVADQLDLDIRPGDVWQAHHGPNMNFEGYLRREVLPRFDVPMVWGLDEVDRLSSCEFGSEVFGLFRSWHNARSLNPNAPWHKLTLVMAYATEAHLFVKDPHQSPFNVGTGLMVKDFTIEMIADLNRRYGSPLQQADDLVRFSWMVGGHPFLVQCGLHAMATRGLSIDAIESAAELDEGPFGDHLRRMLASLTREPAMWAGMLSVLKGTPDLDEERFYRLRSAGIVTGHSRLEARPRCQLYTSFLQRYVT